MRSVLTIGGPVQEEIVTFDPPERLDYRMVRGGKPILENYHGSVVLTPTADGGTEIGWTVAFTPKPSTLRPLIERLVRLGSDRFATELATTADARAGRIGQSGT